MTTQYVTAPVHLDGILFLECSGDVIRTPATRDDPGYTDIGNEIDIVITDGDKLRIALTKEQTIEMVKNYYDQIEEALIEAASDDF
jgi:hypothetical protein